MAGKRQITRTRKTIIERRLHFLPHSSLCRT